jgi:hypothetical protein
MVPTKEEEAKLFGYKGDINELGSAEKFVRVVLSIPFAFEQVEAMLYRETFEDEVVHLRNSFSMLEVTIKTIQQSNFSSKQYFNTTYTFLSNSYLMPGGLQRTQVKQTLPKVA